MALNTVALARRLLLAGLTLALMPGCTTTPSDAKTSRAMNRQMDRMERMGDDLSRRESGGVVRSQAPGESRVNLTAGASGESRVNLVAATTPATTTPDSAQPIGPPVILPAAATDKPAPAATV